MHEVLIDIKNYEDSIAERSKIDIPFIRRKEQSIARMKGRVAKLQPHVQRARASRKGVERPAYTVRELIDYAESFGCNMSAYEQLRNQDVYIHYCPCPECRENIRRMQENVRSVS